MTKKTADLNVFLANLAALNIKVHNLHWNLVGENFLALHKMTEIISQTLQLHFDETAELMKAQGLFPMASLAEYLEKTTVSEIESRNYSCYEVLEELDMECQNLMDNAMKIREDAEKKDNFLVVNAMEKYLEIYALQSWHIKAMLSEYDEDDDDNDDEFEEDELIEEDEDLNDDTKEK